MSLETLPPGMPVAGSSPRGSLVLRAGELPGVRADLWMAGAQTHVGEPLAAEWFADAWVIDCAGDLPSHYRLAGAARWEACVFPDIEVEPVKLGRLVRLASEFAAEALRTGEGHRRFVTVCQHGMNRSGLAAGLLLRALGMPGDEALARIRAARPGAIGNRAFEAILRSEFRAPNPEQG